MALPPGKRKFLSSQEFAARHGAAHGDLDAIARFAHTYGITMVETSFLAGLSSSQARPGN
jgi:hypothetical protein